MRAVLDSIEPIESLDELHKRIVVPREDFEFWLQKWDWTVHQLARNEFPAPFTSIDEFQLACICNDPVLWCSSFLRDPDDPEKPWEFWNYQADSIRHNGNTLHECGAEVGKTREIIAYILYKAFINYRGSGLVTAPMYTHVIEIVDAIIEQFSFNKNLRKSLILHRKHPHHHLRFSNGFKIDFRPTGFDGEALRGVHVRTFAIMDEATKIKNPDIFKEFWRATKPGCIHKIYSTPDGDRSCTFYRLCQKAEGKIKEVDDDAALKFDNLKNLDFKKFHWSKELMPSPFWTPERRRFYIDQYGGEDSPGYQQNVLGNWGDPENSIFPWYQFQRLLKDIPEYKCLKIMVDESQGEVSIFGTRYAMSTDISRSEEIILCDRRIRRSDFDIRIEIKAFFSNISGLKFGGADLGFSQDPTEIYIKLIIGKTHRLIARVQLKSVSYDQQAEAIDALDDIFDTGDHKMGWGLDFGNAGSAVVHNLQNQEIYFDKHYEDRLTGFQFAATYEAVNEDGEVIMDKFTQKPVKLSAKELATDLLVKKMQRQELEYPFDPDLMLFYPNHTYREGERHRIYKKEDDHVIDADRVLTLRKILPGEGMEDYFASGSNMR